MKLTFLGTGTSFGVPQVGCHCAVCRSADPRDRRSRCGAVIETDGGTRLLIDTPPELRLQLVSNRIDSIDAVLYTHEHADHIHGIDDLRAFTMRRAEALPLYGLQATLATIAERFRYIVDDRLDIMPGTTKPNGALMPVTPGVAFQVGDANVLPFIVPHGRTDVVGYRFGPIGYVTDAKLLDSSARAMLEGVEVLVLNALLRRSHPTHLSIGEAVATAAEIGARHTYFTHLTHDNLHADLAAELPAGMSPAYDGLTVHAPSANVPRASIT
ncbi:MAG TPA: MBL fold metallo-hydrolase [Gemmatimonas sp.]|nr:MBL fold metallo-hydrolase [Gemmatimonas sp.]